MNELWPGPYWPFSEQVLNTGTGLLVQLFGSMRSLPRSAVSRPTAYGTPVPDAEYVMKILSSWNRNAGPSLTRKSMHSQSYSGLVSITGSAASVHGFAIGAMYRLELPGMS